MGNTVSCKFGSHQRESYGDYLYYQNWLKEQNSDSKSCAKWRRIVTTYIYSFMKLNLTPRQFMCYTEYFVNDKTMREIGEMLGISKSTVCRHISSAKKKMESLGDLSELMNGGE